MNEALGLVTGPWWWFYIHNIKISNVVISPRKFACYDQLLRRSVDLGWECFQLKCKHLTRADINSNGYELH